MKIAPMKYFWIAFSLLFTANLYCFNLSGYTLIFPRDSIAITDTAAYIDSVFTADSLSRFDSLSQADKFTPMLFDNSKSDSLEFVYSINGEELTFLDYRSAGNISTYLPFGFLQDLGQPGLISEVQFYGSGFNAISWLEDGISRNNRLNNSINTNYVPTERIESVELVPLPKGFLYGNASNPVTVKFVGNNEIPSLPYTKMRILLAPDEEALVNVFYSRYITSRLPAYLEITNNSHNSDGALSNNTNHSGWQIRAGAEYYLYKNLTISANYSNLFSRTGLSGGINPGLLVAGNRQPNIYSYDGANVIYSNRYTKNLQHNFDLGVTAEFIKFSPMTVRFYSLFNQDQFRQNEVSSGKIDNNYPEIINDQKYTALGSSINQKISRGNLLIDLNANFEQINYQGDIFGKKEKDNSIAFSAEGKYYLIDSLFVPSIYAKSVKNDNEDYVSYGADITLNLDSTIQFYTGISLSQQPFNPIEKLLTVKSKNVLKKQTTAAEAGIKLNSEILKGSLSFFNLIQKNHIFPSSAIMYDSTEIFSDDFYAVRKVNRSGINLNFNIDLWKLSAQFNGSYYFNESKNIENTISKYTLFSGLYYKDILFNDNLELKAGVNFYAFSRQNYRAYDFETILPVTRLINPDNASPVFSLYKTPENYQLDLFISGRIQKLAVVSITWENLTNNEYYIVPLFPKQTRGVRFNISWELFN